MIQRKTVNVAESVRDRLRNVAKTDTRNYNLLLQYYAIERLLFRLSQSEYVERFVLKGALLLHAFGGDLRRATRDVDFWSSIENTEASIRKMIGECIRADVPDDGVVFDETSLELEPNQLESRDCGYRLALAAQIGTAKVKVKMDIAFGSPIIPDPDWVTYPQMLDFGSPRLLGYPKESVIADKFEAIVSRDLANSRVKDYYDIWVLSQVESFRGTLLRRAVEATFGYYDTAIPQERPLGLTPAFFMDATKQRMWKAFLDQTNIGKAPPFEVVAERLQRFLMPICESIHAPTVERRVWNIGNSLWE